MVRRGTCCSLMGALLLTLTSVAGAGPADLQGISAPQQGRANPVAASAAGISSVVMNPARIGTRSGQQFFGIVTSTDRAKIRLRERDPEADVASSIYRARSADGSPIPHNLATSDLPNSRQGRTGFPTEVGVVLGMVLPIIKNELSIGVVGYLPGRGSPAKTFYADEREAVFSNRLHLALHEDDHGAQLIAGAIAYEPLPWLKLGFGVQLSIGADTAASTYLPDTLGELSNQSNLTLEIRPSLTPTVGFEAMATKRLALQGAFRTSQATRTTGTSQVRLWADEDDPRAYMEQDLDFALDWQPARAALGASWQGDRWDVGAEGVWLRWSEYVDHHNQRPLAPFDDVFELGLHGSIRYAPWSANAGIRFSPSPVPAQDGRENFVDSDRFIAGTSLGRHLELAGEHVEIAIGTQLSRLRRRSEIKRDLSTGGVIDEYPDAIDLAGNPLPESQGLQTNNPGWPGYTVSGWLWATSLTLTWNR